MLEKMPLSPARLRVNVPQREARGEPTFINLDAPYPSQVFTILVWGDDRKNVGELPNVGSHVCAKGLITDYRGVPEIVVRSAEQLSK
jgi:hypothetical protein